MAELVNVKITDNAEAIRGLMEDAIAAGLEAIGLTAEGHAKEICPVDTGRLRNSISHAVDGNSALIGTNVEYAEAVELGTNRRRPTPYLRPAVTDYIDEYKALMEEALKNG